MAWIALGAWIAAVVAAVVILGYGAYELRWKSRRLRADLAVLAVDTQALHQVQARLTTVAAAHSRRGGDPA